MAQKNQKKMKNSNTYLEVKYWYVIHQLCCVCPMKLISYQKKRKILNENPMSNVRYKWSSHFLPYLTNWFNIFLLHFWVFIILIYSSPITFIDFLLQCRQVLTMIISSNCFKAIFNVVSSLLDRNITWY